MKNFTLFFLLTCSFSFTGVLSASVEALNANTKFKNENHSDNILNKQILVDIINGVIEPMCEKIPSNLNAKIINCPSSNRILSFPVFETMYYCEIFDGVTGEPSKLQFKVNQFSVDIYSSTSTGVEIVNPNGHNGPCPRLKYLYQNKLICEIYFNSDISTSNGIINIRMNFEFYNENCEGSYKVALGQCEEVGFNDEDVINRGDNTEQENIESIKIKNNNIVFPNPFNDFLYIYCDSIIENKRFSWLIRDIRGNIVDEYSGNLKLDGSLVKLNTERFISRVYFLTLMNEEKISNYKLIK